MENWKEIPSNPFYKVSDLGRIKSVRFNRVLRPHDNGGGYMQVTLKVTNGFKSTKVHRLVAEAFIENPLEKPWVNHKNGIKNDNRISNLEWCTPKENTQHSLRNGFQTFLIGEKHGSARLNQAQVDQLRLDAKHMSYAELSKKYKISAIQANHICIGRSWKESFVSKFI